MKKVSEMIISVAGDLLRMPENKEEMQSHLELVKHAWNMSLHSANKRKEKLLQAKKLLKDWNGN